MIFSCVVPFKRKKKKIPDLSLPPCIAAVNGIYTYFTQYDRNHLWGSTSELCASECSPTPLPGSWISAAFFKIVSKRRMFF
jgi:hypothetical protein